MLITKNRILVLFLLIAVTAFSATAQTASKLGQAWTLGSKLSLAAALHAEGETALSGRQFNAATAAASDFGIKLPPLPTRTGKRVEDSASVLNYLLSQTGNPIGGILAKSYGAEHAAVFEVALKSNILLIMYGPNDTTAAAIAKVIRSRSENAKYLNGMTTRLVAAVERNAPYETVKKELFDLHDLAPKFLSVIQFSRDGEAKYAARDYAGSVAEFTKALAIDPEGAEYFFGRGRANMQLGNNVQALADYTRAIQLEGKGPQNAKNLSVAYHNRGLLYGMTGKNALAIADLTEAIRLRPDYASAFKVRGLVYQKMGNAKSAAADLQKAEQLQPGITK